MALTGRGLFFGMSDRRKKAGDEGKGARDGHEFLTFVSE
jgi:hypothetical protein